MNFIPKMTEIITSQSMYLSSRITLKVFVCVCFCVCVCVCTRVSLHDTTAQYRVLVTFIQVS